MQLRPSEIYFSQAEINSRFDKKSMHAGQNIGETLDALVEGRCSIRSIPTISVKRIGEKWVTADNRRLWVFRHLEKLGGCSEIQVLQTNSIDSRKMKSNNGGRTVRFYSGRYATGRHHSRVTSIDPGEQSAGDGSFGSRSLSNEYGELSYLYKRSSTNISGAFGSLSLNQNNVRPMLSPSNLRYTKESVKINPFFEQLKMTLRYNHSHAKRIDPVDVYKVYGIHWVTDGNKRLWSFKEAHSKNPEVQINVDVKDDKEEFLDLMRKDRPYLSVIDIIQSGENIQIAY